MHKTGSTSIQAFCNRKREDLLARGLLYPKTGLVDSIPHHYLLALSAAKRRSMREALLRGFDRKTAAYLSGLARTESLEKLQREVAEAGEVDVLLSSEHFCSLDYASVDRFCSLFDGFEIVPLFVLRNFADWWNSWYNTYVMFSRGTDSPEGMSWKPDVVRACRAWSGAPGCDRMVVMDYDGLSKSRDRFVQLFFEKAGISLAGPIDWDASAQNVSSSPWTIVLARELRKSGASDESIRGLSARFDAIPRKGAYSFLSVDELRRYDALFEQTIRELADMPKIEGISVEGFAKKDRDQATIKVIRTLEDALSAVAIAVPD